MDTDHSDLATRAFDLADLPSPPRAPEDALRYINILLSLCPPSEAAGYVLKPGGANIAALPDGTLVSCSRVMYADGTMYKVLTDAPNGAPEWALEGPDDPAKYLAFLGVPGPGPGPTPKPPPGPPPTDLTARVIELEARLQLLAGTMTMLHDRIEAINTRFDAESSVLNVHKPLPLYTGTIFGMRITSRPEL